MKRITELPLEECHEILDRIVGAMFGDLDANDRKILNPDAPWSATTLADIDMALASYDIRPYEVIDIEEPEDHTDDICACGDQDCSRPINHE